MPTLLQNVKRGLRKFRQSQRLWHVAADRELRKIMLSRTYSVARALGFAHLGIQRRVVSGLTDHRPNKFEKWLLVYFKRYPKGQVPNLIPQDQMEKVRNLARIYINIGMCVCTLFGAILAIYFGKKAHRLGRTVHQVNLEWHEELRKEGEKEKASKK